CLLECHFRWEILPCQSNRLLPARWTPPCARVPRRNGSKVRLLHVRSLRCRRRRRRSLCIVALITCLEFPRLVRLLVASPQLTSQRRSPRLASTQRFQSPAQGKL